MKSPKAPNPNKMGPGMVKISLRMTFADGTDAWRQALVPEDQAAVAAWKYARALHAGWLAQLVDTTPVPKDADINAILVQELNIQSNDFNRFGRGTKDQSDING